MRGRRQGHPGILAGLKDIVGRAGPPVNKPPLNALAFASRGPRNVKVRVIEKLVFLRSTGLLGHFRD